MKLSGYNLTDSDLAYYKQSLSIASDYYQEDMQHMSLPTHIKKLKSLAEKAFDSVGKLSDALTILRDAHYLSMPLDAPYKQFRKEKTELFIETLKRQQEFQRASYRWAFIQLPARVSLLQGIANAHQSMYQYQGAARVKLINSRSTPMLGKYEHNAHTIYINRSHEKFSDFYWVLEAVLHETQHALQNQLTRQPALIKTYPDLQIQRDVFYYSLRPGMTTTLEKDGALMYHAHPVEKGAWLIGKKVRNDLELAWRKETLES